MPTAKSAPKTVQAHETKKTTKTSKNTMPVATVESVATTTTATTVPKKETKSRSKKEETVVEVVPATEPVEVQNVVVNTDSESSISANFTQFIAKFQGMMSQFSTLKTELKTLERQTVKQLKIVQKLNNKKKRKGTRAPSGFVKPAPISSELAQFLGRPEGTEMARTDVTREINKYIRANDLQDKENGRKINPDKLLCELLKVTPEVNLTYFNLQRYMGPHFPKSLKEQQNVAAN